MRERGCKKKERGQEGGGVREEFAKMPSHGSLQQAVKVRPGRGERERREGKKERKKSLSGFAG